MFFEVLDLAAEAVDLGRSLAGGLVLADLVDGGLGRLAVGGLGVGGHEGGEDRDGPHVAQFPEGGHGGGGHRVLEVVDLPEEEVADRILVVLVAGEVGQRFQGLGEAPAREGGLGLFEVPQEGLHVEDVILLAHGGDGLA